MSLRPLNDTVIIECEEIKPEIETTLELPDKNSLVKLTPYATVISYGPKCIYKFKPGQRIIYQQFRDKPMWYEYEGKRYRMIKEHYILAVYEDM